MPRTKNTLNSDRHLMLDSEKNTHNMLNEVSIDRELGKRSFHDFVRLTWPAIDPAPFADGWHIKLICKYLEKCYRREIKRLVINIPPRHCKSSIVAVLFPVWCWIQDASIRFFFFSYALNLCERDSVKCRRLIESDWFRERWGDIVELADDQNQKRRYETTKQGYRTIASVGGSVTGEGGDFLIVDDPHNVVEGESESVRRSTVEWWKEAVSTRLNDAKTGVKIIIQQRVHEEDLAGEMIKVGYKHLVLPCKYEYDHPYVHPEDPREIDGELIWEEKFGEREVKNLEDAMGVYAAAGQLQQRPAPRQGGMFDPKWFKEITYDKVPSGGIIVRGWDLAASSDKRAAWTCGVLIKKVEGKYYIINVCRFRLTPGALEAKIKAIVDADDEGHHVRLQSFPQDPASAGKLSAQHLKTMLAGYPIRTSLESGDKEIRAQSFAAQVEIGNVFIVKDVWNEIYLDECGSFPNGKFLDQVDASSRAFHEIRLLEKMGNQHGVAGSPEILMGKSDKMVVGYNKDEMTYKTKFVDKPDGVPVVSGPVM